MKEHEKPMSGTLQRQILLVLASAFLVPLAFSEANVGWSIFFSLVPFLLALDHCSLLRGFFLGWLWGGVVYLLHLSWIRIFGTAPWIVCSLFQGLFFALFSLFYSLIQQWMESPHARRLSCLVTPLSASSLWVVLDWVRSLGPLGFPWASLAYTQWNFLQLIQVASLTGIWGITFLIVFVNASLASLLKRLLHPGTVSGLRRDLRDLRPSRSPDAGEGLEAGLPLFLTLLVFTLLCSWGAKVLKASENHFPSPAVPVIIVQTNFEQNMKWQESFFEQEMAAIERLMAQARGKNPQLVILPETAVPKFLKLDPAAAAMVSRWAVLSGSSLMTGALDWTGTRDLNVIFLFSPQGELLGEYAKVHLVPFGEYLPAPLKKTIGHWKVFSPVQNFAAGKAPSLLSFPSLKISPLICFESLFPHLSRTLTRMGGEVLVTVTNDAWFEGSSAPFHHFIAGVFRAIETRNYFVQCGNKGISCIIDPWGRILKESRVDSETLLAGVIGKGEGSPLYVKWGDWVVFLCFIFIVSIVCSLLSMGGGSSMEPLERGMAKGQNK